MEKILYLKRPWGRQEQFTLNERTTVKLLYVKAGRRLSYQYHDKRSEFWRVVKGKVKVTLNGRNKILSDDGMVWLPQGAKHRAEGIEDSVILEIDYGHFDENDIVRLDDDYNRVKM